MKIGVFSKVTNSADMHCFIDEQADSIDLNIFEWLP